MGIKTEIIKLIESMPDIAKAEALRYVRELSRKYRRTKKDEEADFGQIDDKKEMSCADLLNSDLVGIWKDRDDITDSVQFIDEIRNKMSRRESDESN